MIFMNFVIADQSVISFCINNIINSVGPVDAYRVYELKNWVSISSNETLSQGAKPGTNLPDLLYIGLPGITFS